MNIRGKFLLYTRYFNTKIFVCISKKTKVNLVIINLNIYK